jgi:ornithine--oxo-acid transaminase
MSRFIPLNQREYKPLGPESAEIIERINRYSARNYDPYPFVVDRAEGAWLYDPDGNKALDFLSAYSAVLYHNQRDVIEAVKKEMDHGSDLTSRAVYASRYADFVEALAELTGYDRVLPKSDGGSVTDSAIKALFMHAHERKIKNPEIILTKDYFHGRPLVFASNAFFDDDQCYGLDLRMPGIVVVDNTPEAVEKAINQNTIGMFIETHKGEGGPLFSTKEDYMAMRNLARNKGIFFGADEIQTGLGRCGYIMAWQEFAEKGEETGKEKARPDFVTLGKALGAGIIPVSAIVGTEEFMRIFKPGIDGSTHGGYPLACAAACASLEYIKKERIPEKSRKLGDYFVDQLKGIPGINVDHRGLLIRVEIEGVKTAKYACLEMLLGEGWDPRVFMKHGHSTQRGGTSFAYTRIVPPIGAITEELIDEAVEKTIRPVLELARK